MKTGIFGGSFDPPHIGHINMALAVKEKMELDRIVFVPTGKAPHKKELSHVSHRVNMCKMICDKYGFALSTYEAEKEGNSYTADLLSHFKKEYPQEKLYLIVGGDSLDYMDKWYKPERIFSQCKVVVIRRKGTDDKKAKLLKAKFKAEIEFIDCEYFDFSSTSVREKVLGNENIDALVLPEIAEYIKKNNLYR